MLYFLKKMAKFIMNSYYKRRIVNTCKSFKGRIIVKGKTIVNTNTVLGENVSFNGLIIAGNGEVAIGDNFHSGAECIFFTDIHNYDHGTALPYDNTVISKKITVQDNVWIGSRVIVLGGVTIEEGVVIQAGSVVVSNIPKYAVAGGNPAKVFKYRDIDHYEKLKNEKKFLV